MGNMLTAQAEFQRGPTAVSSGVRPERVSTGSGMISPKRAAGMARSAAASGTIYVLDTDVLVGAMAAVLGEHYTRGAVAISGRQAVEKAIAEPADGLDAETLEAARREIRKGFQEGLAPIREMLASAEHLLRRASEINQRLKKRRGLSK